MLRSIPENHTPKLHTIIIVALLLFISGCDIFAPGWDKMGARHKFASWSPSSEWIAFYDGVENYICLVDTTGLKTHKIMSMDTPGLSDIRDLTWSPDSRWIAFASSGDIFRMTAEGDSLTRLTNIGDLGHPSWSRSGEYIAFQKWDDSVREGSIWFMHADTLETTLLAESGESPSWHPDSVRVVFQKNQQMDQGHIYAVNIETMEIDTLANIKTSSGLYYHNAEINPQGDAVVFDVSPLDGPSEIFKYNIATTELTWITRGGGSYPSWSPDGKWIVYTYVWDGNGGLWISNSDGTWKRQLTDP